MRIAVIPARGGSKRIPKKNIKVFHGKPIIGYSIEAALNSGCFDKVIVSTDDIEVATIAKRFGAEVPFMRPANIADDHTGTMDVVRHAIEWFSGEDLNVEYVCCIYATAPFISAESIKRGYDALTKGSFKFSFSATNYCFPIQRSFKRNSDGSVQMFTPEYSDCRSQDLDEAYHDAGQFYWGRSHAFLNNSSIFSEQSFAVLIPRIRVQDIDTLEDWEIAEKLYLLL